MSYIDWVDHHGYEDRVWRTQAELVEASGYDVVIRSWGKIVHEDKTRVILVSEERLDEDISVPIYRFTHTIMKKLIVSRGE